MLITTVLRIGKHRKRITKLQLIFTIRNTLSNMGRNKKQIAGNVPINLRFQKRVGDRKAILIDHFYDGKHHYENTGMFLIAETNEKTKRENARTMRKANDLLHQRIDEYFSSKSAPVTEEHPVTILEWFDFFIEEQQRRGIKAISRIKSYRRILAMFDNKTLLKDVDKAFCLRFITYLRNEYMTKQGKRLSPKSIFNFCGYLSCSLNMAVRTDRIESNPWNRLSRNEKPKNDTSKREYLTIAEVRMLIETPCKKDIVKRAYLFSCFCGLRLGDLISLKWESITNDDKRWSVGIVASKNQRVLHIPLSAQAMKWLPERTGEFVFPTLKNQSVSHHLKNWAKAAGISKTVTFHTSRHTFATMLLTLGTDIYTVSKMLGHSSVKPTQIYARIVDEAKDNAVCLADGIDW